MPLGPVQLLVVGFDRPDFSGEVLAEFERLRDSDVVRVIDLLVVHKGADGWSSACTGPTYAARRGRRRCRRRADRPRRDGRRARGRYLPAEEELWSLDEAIPNDSAAAIALVEHRWAIGTRDAIRAAGGFPVADAWIHPADLVAAGLIDAEDAGPPTGTQRSVP